MEPALLNIETITIRWSDMDAYAHVAHQKYFDYLTETRHAELVKPYLPNPTEKFFLVDIQCEFKKQLVYPGEITVKQYLAAKGNSSFALTFEFFNDEQQLCAEAYCVLVCVDAKTDKKVAIPNYLQEKFDCSVPEKYPTTPIAITDDLEPLLIKTVPLRYADMDAFRHVNNTRYFEFLLEARHALFPNHNPLIAPCYFFIINARTVFHKPLYYPGEVQVPIYLTHLGRSSFTFGYKIYRSEDPDTLYAESETTLVCVDKETFKPIKVPDEMLKLVGKLN
ncbi:MAG: acyl-CoA thioesterase [Gammaproteobacteria bacterium]|nr:acyl-CoA thioesterase [Gammaproteobacteria bacterium]